MTEFVFCSMQNHVDFFTSHSVLPTHTNLLSKISQRIVLCYGTEWSSRENRLPKGVEFSLTVEAYFYHSWTNKSVTIVSGRIKDPVRCRRCKSDLQATKYLTPQLSFANVLKHCTVKYKSKFICPSLCSKTCLSTEAFQSFAKYLSLDNNCFRYFQASLTILGILLPEWNPQLQILLGAQGKIDLIAA